MSNNMSISSIKEHYNNLCTKAKEWSAAYYEQDAPVVTDEEYDSGCTRFVISKRHILSS